MKVKFYLFQVLVLAVFWSCSENSGVKGEEPGYFPIKEYIEVHAEKLVGKNLVKTVNVNGETENSNSTPDLEEILKELDFFIQADINKPALTNAYETQRSERFLIHELKEGEKGKIKKIVVEYLGGDVKQVSFQSVTENPFYSSKTRGIVIIHDVTGLIDNFAVETLQEVIFSKPNRIIISGHFRE